MKFYLEEYEIGHQLRQITKEYIEYRKENLTSSEKIIVLIDGATIKMRYIEPSLPVDKVTVRLLFMVDSTRRKRAENQRNCSPASCV